MRNFRQSFAADDIFRCIFFLGALRVKTVGPAHEIWVLIAYAQMSLINVRANLSSGAKGPIFGMSLHLQPYFAYVSSEGSGESVHVHRLA